MKVNVRRATSSDAAALADLVTQLGYPSRPEEVIARLATLESAEQGLFVAEVDKRVVGLAHVNCRSTLLADGMAEVMALVVDDKWRGQGIGRALLQVTEEWAGQRGYGTLLVRTNVVRQRAHEFYYRNGFRHVKTSLTLVKELPPKTQ